MANYTPFVYFTPKGGSCVAQVATKWKATGKPIFAPAGKPPHTKITGKVRVHPLPIVGDGGVTCWMLTQYSTIPLETLYVRKQDGNISSK